MPLTGKLLIFVDGACEPRNPAGVPTYGFVIYRDAEKLAEESGVAAEPWTEQASNNVAEYVALIKALERVQLLHLEGSEIEVRADSKLLVEQVNGVYDVKAPRLVPLNRRVKGLLTNFKNINFRWVRREENAEADELSKAAYLAYMRTYDYSGFRHSFEY